MSQNTAPGAPGIEPRWTSSDKSGVGTALSALSRVWFTTSHGILNEIYYPRVDQACIRDFGMIVTDGTPGGFFAEEKRETQTVISNFEDGVPAYELVNTCNHGRYVIRKRIVADHFHDVLLQEVRFEAHTPNIRLFGLLAPHLVNGGADNSAWLADYKGTRMLFAEGHGTYIALGCSRPFLARSVGYVGHSDGWQELFRHGSLPNQWDHAPNGNVALCAELDVADGSPLVLALGFGRGWAEAAFRVRAALDRRFDVMAEEYVAAWREWQRPLRDLRGASTERNSYRISTAVLRAHDSPNFPGGIIASLSIPWGATKGDDDLGGYHLVWPRDLVETAGGLLAAGAFDDARRVAQYLRATQEADGHWPQNCWLDGTPYWQGVQMDECAFPILLIDMMRRAGALEAAALPAYWPMVEKACGFVLRNGPATGQDRWEEDGGYSTFTLAVEIAALLAGADLADLAGRPALAELLRDTADAWNDAIEAWTYVTGTDLARAAGVGGYYVRITPPDPGTADAALQDQVAIKNRPADKTYLPARDVISPDALALVRFGLRDANDLRIVDTVRAIDHALRVELPAGPCWYRYNNDGYGEHEDGQGFNGVGIGRLWPLMTGERAMYELAAGRPEEARRLLGAMEACSSRGGLIPEQVWDTDDIPVHELFRGRPSGSAMPLVWAHAEHIKLIRSLADGAVFDMPPQTRARYAKGHTGPRVQPWREDWQARRLVAGRTLRLDLSQPATVEWSDDGWATTQAKHTADVGAGLHVVELPSAARAGGKLAFRLGASEYAVEIV